MLLHPLKLIRNCRNLHPFRSLAHEFHEHVGDVIVGILPVRSAVCDIAFETIYDGGAQDEIDQAIKESLNLADSKSETVEGEHRKGISEGNLGKTLLCLGSANVDQQSYQPIRL